MGRAEAHSHEASTKTPFDIFMDMFSFHKLGKISIEQRVSRLMRLNARLARSEPQLKLQDQHLIGLLIKGLAAELGHKVLMMVTEGTIKNVERLLQLLSSEEERIKEPLVSEIAAARKEAMDQGRNELSRATVSAVARKAI